MPLIRAALRDQIVLCAASPAFCSEWVSGFPMKFLNGIHGSMSGDVKGKSAGKVVDVKSIQCHVALIGASACCRSFAALRRIFAAAGGSYNSRLIDHQFSWVIARLNGQTTH